MNTGIIDLHLHLDGSLYLPWAYKTAVKRGVVPADWTFEDYYNQMYFNNYKTREEGFKKFEFPCDVMQTKEDLHDSAYTLIEQLSAKDYIYAELRFASQQHCRGGLTQKEVVEAVISGIEDARVDFPNVMVKLINCLMHKGNSALFNDAENRETIEVTKECLGDVLVGLDLAGFENNCPFSDYGYLFEIARSYGIPYTIHAGEMGMGEHVMDALAMKPNRIGHGVNCTQNPEWLAAVVKSGVPLEVCTTSNVAKYERNYAAHPIRELIAAGVKVCPCADNMTFHRNDMAYEHAMLRAIGVSEDTLVQCVYNAIDAAFCTETEKETLRKKAFERFGR